MDRFQALAEVIAEQRQYIAQLEADVDTLTSRVNTYQSKYDAADDMCTALREQNNLYAEENRRLLRELLEFAEPKEESYE